MSSSESSEEEDEEAQSEEDNSKPFKGARPTVDDNLFTEDESGSDSTQSFIVEDDSQAVTAQLPTEFSMRSHDDLAHQFKIIFQFFVHIAVRPSIDRQSFMENQMKRMNLFCIPCHILIQYRPGLFFLPFKNYPEKIVGAQRLSCSFFSVATKIQEDTRRLS